MLYVKSLEPEVVAAYPYEIFQLRHDNPNVSFPQFGMAAMTDEELALYNTYPVISTEPPTIDPETESLVDSCAFVDGEWVQIWFVVPL